MNRAIRTYATVQLTVEVALSQPWDGGEKMEEVFRVATRDAPQIVGEMITKFRSSGADIRIIGMPKVTLASLEDSTP